MLFYNTFFIFLKKMELNASHQWHFVRTNADCTADTDALYTEHFKCGAIVFFSIGFVLKLAFDSYFTDSQPALSQTGMRTDLTGTAQTQKLKCF